MVLKSNRKEIKKSWYKKWWAIILYIFIGLVILSIIFGEDNSSQGKDSSKVGYSRNKPVSLNTLVTLSFETHYAYPQLVNAEVTLIDIRRGAEAWSMIVNADPYYISRPPKDGKEYLLAKFRVKILSISDSKAYPLFSNDFDAVSENGIVYDKPNYIAQLNPDITGDIYAGATKEGWVAFEIDKSDTNPLISFNRNNLNQDEIWFSMK